MSAIKDWKQASKTFNGIFFVVNCNSSLNDSSFNKLTLQL
ncbi:hypothetical protein SAMN06265377_2689 [Flagellimonas pacifica]|uniref:Uncharacterized protein n=1 Tax=Flagellimonas pacifica TaxID=1247520 RepID=A0A285MUL0_9FLAO|nr:hypothetical protein SAMN06265377_2689 [Allomuricauda parva]